MSVLRLSLFTVLVLSVSTSPALAYVWYGTQSTRDPLRWFHTELSIRTGEVVPPGIGDSAMHSAAEAAFSAWTELPGCRTPQVEMLGTTGAQTITTPTSLDDAPDNVVLFIGSTSKWRELPGATSSQVALTFIAHNPQTGQILDADIALNSGSFSFRTDESGSGVDLQSVITHEAGHFFGMEHSTDPTATMYAEYDQQGSAARTLAPDDIDGICELYRLHPCDACDSNQDCENGVCVEKCVRTHDGKQCGSDGCGGGSVPRAPTLLILLMCPVFALAWLRHTRRRHRT